MELINIKTKQLVLATTAALAGTVLMTSAKANADTTVTVQSGDTVWGLSQEYQVSMASIVQANQLANPDLIYVGDQLTIPTSAAKSSQKASSATAQQTAAAAPASQTTSASATTVTLPLSATSATPSAAPSSSAAQLVTTSANQLVTTPRVENNGSTSVSSLAAAPATSTANIATTAVNVASTTPVTSTPTANNSTNTATAGTPVASTAPTTSAAAGTATNGVTTYTPSEAVARAQSVEGTPYVWGGNTTSGFDCSGLVQWAYGLSSDYRTTYQQQALGTHQYDIANAPAGAIYFWGSDSAPYHDAIATGNGNYIAAPDVGQTVSTSSINYYTPSYYVVVGQ
ncbi:C40 family peptidase [Limosilactobacillus ingluviei]|uniref:NLP P60 protein n=1 Tax=Limosilactobacillus ingluviei TaxID=148604 RepID=A0A0R2H3U8_9LACO|nr:C40 family peptidase [Limosilactobacillus ingluviei]KRN44796.1 NLP P60 protein [Limosilactobacillus ingluviei]